MAQDNKVIWTEGMFLRPQHFQQQEQHFRSLVEARCTSLQGDTWGVSELLFDDQLLALGKIAITSCRGVFPDGTPFRIPFDSTQPLPLEVHNETQNEIVYLSLPMQTNSGRDVSEIQSNETLNRYHLTELQKKDTYSNTQASTITIETGALCPRLQLNNKNMGAFVNMPIARIIEKKSDNQVLLDSQFIPTCTNCNASTRLANYIKEIQGLLQLRGNTLASRIGSPGTSGVADIADFLLLQIINRYEPLFNHWSQKNYLHPESLFRTLGQMAGELATITDVSRRPTKLPDYAHNDLNSSFEIPMEAVRNTLNWVPDIRALSIPLEEHKYGIRTANINDPQLVRSANFILAVNAQIPADKLRLSFPKQITIATTEKLRDLVMTHTPGIEMRALEVAPKQIPFHTGFTYFELDKYSEQWSTIETSGAIAMHLSGEYPGLEIEFWAIKG